MSTIQLRTFTDRREAIALFQSLLGRDPSKPWPLLPILAFIAPGGSGKSTLIEYLRVTACCLPDPQESSVLPYAHLDFTLAGAPTDLLSILIALRNQLQQHQDGQGRHLTFPRFDLGAAIAAATPSDGTLPLLNEQDLRQRLAAGLPLIGPLGEMVNALGWYFPLIPPLLVGLQWVGQLPPLQTLLQRLEQGPGWRWYQVQSIEVGLPPQASITQVLLRLHELSIPGTPGREVLVERLVPAAFLADLRDALDGPHAALAWGKAATVVLFLDGFDALLEGKGSTGIRLLEVLACATHRKQGQTDPLLLVLGSRQRLLELTDVEQHPPFEDMTRVVDDALVRDQVHARYTSWQQDLPVPDKRHYLRLRDLFLPFWLQDFGLEHTREYLARVGEQEDTAVLTYEPLVQAIHHATLGHPLYTALAAAAMLEAEAHGQPLSLEALTNAPVSPEVVRGHQDEAIGDYLLGLFLRQLSATEQQAVIFCAVPRTLNVAAVQVVLQCSSEEAQERWNRFRRYTFVRLLDEQHLVLHPIVRALLLQQLPAPLPQLLAESDYFHIHQRLRNHFHRLAQLQETAVQRTVQGQAQLEEAYHALALGDSAPAIRLGITAQQKALLLWQPLLDAVAQVPTGLLPGNAERQASSALLQAEQHRNVQDGVTAIVLYTWLLTAARGNLTKRAARLHNLGTAYWVLPGGDRQANLQQAITCYTQVLEVHTREAFPADWAQTQNNLGVAYQELPGGDRQANLQQAITCYTQALEVYTREAFPERWAGIKNNPGTAYNDLLGGDRQANLQQTITCYTQALEVYTREAFPERWAMTQNNLGNAYSDLPGGDRQANLQRAIACYTQALEVRTREAFPAERAATQNSLGNAYSDLPGGDRQANLQRAIACYTQALAVYTREVFPFEWAMTQNNLGNAYWALPGGDRQVNLQQAITCYTQALQVLQSLHVDSYARMVQRNLDEVRDVL